MQARIEELGERLNPIIVKEVRQGLRTRIFWVCFALTLLACFVISMVAYGTSLETEALKLGQGSFFAYFVCLGVVFFFIIPYTAYRSLAREREEETWVLLSLTGLGARRIIRGKLGSFLLQALLYGSAVGPFMLFSYYLNGIDLPTILAVIALGTAFMVFLTSVSVCAATLAETRLVRGLVHFLLLGGLFVGTTFALSVAGGLTLDSSRALRDPDVRMAIAAGCWVMVSTGYLLYQAAAARLALPTEDYARGPRRALLMQVVGSVALLAWIWVDQSKEPEWAMIAQGLLMAHLFFVGNFMLSGGEAVHEIHYARRGGSLFRPGSLRGYRFVVLLVACSTAFWCVLCSSSHGTGAEVRFGLHFVIASAAYVLVYLSAPIVIARLTRARALNTAAGLRVLTFALVFAGSGLPPLLGLVAGAKPDAKLLNLFNPVVGSFNFADHGGRLNAGHLAVLVAAGLAAVLLADRALASREEESRRLREQARAGAGAGAPASVANG